MDGNPPRNSLSFDAVRIAQIVRAPTGAPVLRENFIPPVLRVGASPYLLGRFRKLLATRAPWDPE